MTTGTTIVRIFLGLIGALMLAGGLLLVVALGPVEGLGAFWLIVIGGVLLIAVVIEASRYRSQAAEQAKLPPGPGGGEPGPVDPRFRPTDELFVDPTSSKRMRVWVDARTGERRYVAES
jgi:hypothetical protein